MCVQGVMGARPVPIVLYGEDAASVPCVDFKPERVAFGRVVELLVCPFTGMLLTGHSGAPPVLNFWGEHLENR